MATPNQKPVSGDALVLLCAQKINQREHHARSFTEKTQQAQNDSKQVGILQGEIDEIHAAIKAGRPWPAPAEAEAGGE